MHLLVSNLGNHLTYRAVYDTMHHEGFIAGSGEDGYRTNVRSCIKRIRNKFRALDGNFACIANYPSFGYRWEVDPLPTPAASIKASQTSTHSALTSSAIRAGLMRRAEWVEPAAGTTSSNALSETSQ